MNIQINTPPVITAEQAREQGVSLNSLVELLKWHRKKAENHQKSGRIALAVRHSVLIGKINATISALKTA